MTTKEQIGYQNKYNKTKRGLTSKIIRAQRKRSEIRGHKPPEYTLLELRIWMYSHPKFQELFDNWITSGYNKYLIPSIDRLDDNIGYNFDNIQLITWQENESKQHNKQKTKDGQNVKQVEQYLNGKLINTFFSAIEASYKTGINRNSIGLCCRGVNTSAGGYQWKHL